ncbi:MAG: protein-export chaperone SecB [Buchnera aphidicola (Periphyllus lyropictus)]|uniref:protein-export chaperone SecB n=1 Tax=Buchnera aphidicola TaxID=9 RepID=UPI001EB47BBC|nr:protein-export chaperone SecB [Buchnera aphidicola]NIH16765.1 protein-export chaperone SecB [Buchnera aphidicola (Periphyllus lyropictus)]USS94665.1 protein-export chaperone SecB [Buchnera aphidicola (Periphyllus lyropictus)]
MLEKKIKKLKGETKFQIQKIYVKNISFESPYSPSIFKEPWKPKISCDFHTICNDLEKNLFEVTLKITVKVNVELKSIFSCQVYQSGIFYIKKVMEKELPHFLGVYCPNILFPYARECISNLTSKGGFPSLNLDPINFDLAFYQANLKK